MERKEPIMPTMNEETPMHRVRWIQDLGKEILFLDLKQATTAESLVALEDFKLNLRDRPQRSVLLLSDVTSAAYDSSVSARWKSESIACEPLIRGSAIFGMSGMVRVSLRGFQEVQRMMGLNRLAEVQKFCKTRAEALAWLHQR
jgi:hypothetical protein